MDVCATMAKKTKLNKHKHIIFVEDQDLYGQTSTSINSRGEKTRFFCPLSPFHSPSYKTEVRSEGEKTDIRTHARTHAHEWTHKREFWLIQARTKEQADENWTRNRDHADADCS